MSRVITKTRTGNIMQLSNDDLLNELKKRMVIE